MIVVIQCAASKQPNAGHMVTQDGKPVDFVANPHAAPPDHRRVYARPDDSAAGGKSWREHLVEYNKEPGNNPFGLYPAYQLYEKDVYRRLVDRFELRNVYILSAGWGLIGAAFLTPYYDITFSPSAERYKRRRKADRYHDFCMLPIDTDDEVVFFGGKDYLPLFCKLTSQVRSLKTVFYNSANSPRANECKLRRFETATRTNWHYECANAFLDGSIGSR
jgi:hypothetical protein